MSFPTSDPVMPDPLWGHCTLAGDEYSPSTSDRFCAVASYSDSAAELETRSDFGCVEHQEADRG